MLNRGLKFVYVLNCNINFDNLPFNFVSIKRVTKSFLFEKKKCSQTQFPIIPIYVIMDCKSQGETLKNIIVDLRISPDGKWSMFHK
jgi:hypothetical protein